MKILWSLILTTLMLSSPKNEIITGTQNNLNTGIKLLKSYVVDNKWGSFYTYNDDNTLKKIVFKEDGVEKCSTIFTYKNGKIVELLKKKAGKEFVTKKQFEYKGDVIVKETMHTNGKLSEITQFEYDKNNFLKKISEKRIYDNKYESSRIKFIEKLAENKIKVERANVATHVITFDEKLTPESTILGYKPLVQISNNGIVGNILLTEIYPGEECTSTVESDFEFDKDGKTLLSSKVRHKSTYLDETQNFKYNYY